MTLVRTPYDRATLHADVFAGETVTLSVALQQRGEDGSFVDQDLAAFRLEQRVLDEGGELLLAIAPQIVTGEDGRRAAQFTFTVPADWAPATPPRRGLRHGLARYVAPAPSTAWRWALAPRPFLVAPLS